MKKLIFLLIPIISFGQVKDVELINNTLRVKFGNAWEYRGAVDLTGFLKLDANGNLLIGKNPTVTGYNNIVSGNNVTITNAHSIGAFCTDCDFITGSNYSIGGGDAHDIGGYSSTTFGYLNKNFIDGGTAIGTNISLGISTANNRYTRSAAIGSLLRIDNTDVYMFGKGDGSTYTQQGSFIVYGSYKLGLLPDGRISINGIPYRFPTTQSAGVLTNDGQGNLSWGGPVQQPTAFKVYNAQGQLLFYQPVYKN